MGTSPIKPVDNLQTSPGIKFNPETTYDRKYENYDKIWSPTKRPHKRVVPKQSTEKDTQYQVEYQNKTKLADEYRNSPSKYSSPGKYNDLVNVQVIDEKKHYSPSKFGYAGFKSEVKDKFTPQDMQKQGKKDEERKIEHEKGSIRKGD